MIAEPDNELFVSAVTVAEVAIKASLGKLKAPGLHEALHEAGIYELPFTATHAETLGELPWHHRDPFDRMLIAQAIAERLDLVTTDTRLQAYPVVCV
ncbi:hypothetical protein MFM001_06100 [Mycobacterium sp. MFM001]|nr:hypothetical protein MFM001_06100 [Mycobacterium sp. MFM001]